MPPHGSDSEEEEEWKPIWRTGAMVGHFGDAYADSTELEGGFTAASLPVHCAVLKRMLQSQEEISSLTDADVAIISRVLDIMKEADKIEQAALAGEKKPEVSDLSSAH